MTIDDFPANLPAIFTRKAQTKKKLFTGKENVLLKKRKGKKRDDDDEEEEEEVEERLSVRVAVVPTLNFLWCLFDNEKKIAISKSIIKH